MGICATIATGRYACVCARDFAKGDFFFFFFFSNYFFVVVPDVASIQSEDDVMMMTPDAFGIRFQCRLRRRLFNDTDLIDVLSFSTTTKKTRNTN